MIRDQGLRIIVDPVMNWHHFPGHRCRDLHRSRPSSLCVGSRLSRRSRLPRSRWTRLTYRLRRSAEPFAGLCDRAADVGAQVHLEFMPISCVATLREAWTIVGDADRDNGGIVFDTWHFFRGDPDFDLLATVPGDRIYCVQIDDAAATPRTSLRDDTKNRLLPGDGDLDLDPCGPRARRDRCAALGRARGDFPDVRGHARRRSGSARQRQGSGTDR